MDTLRLGPLAFPRHPYHHLVKHYQDGGLKRGRVNDPELDARLALEVFLDQRRALQRAPSVPGGRTPRAPPQGPRLCRSPVRLVSRAARCPQGVEALVRFRRVSTRTRERRRASDAAGHRRGSDGGRACAGYCEAPACRRVTLLEYFGEADRAVRQLRRLPRSVGSRGRDRGCAKNPLGGVPVGPALRGRAPDRHPAGDRDRQDRALRP